MSHLQEVDGWEESASNQQRLDGCLGVTSEQCREAAVTEHHDDRTIVDVTLRKWRRGVGTGRIDDLDRGRRIQEEPLAGPRQHDCRSGLEY